jgi:hypothetical protein
VSRFGGSFNVSDDKWDLGLDHVRGARDLPRAERLANLLYQQCRRGPVVNPNAIDFTDIIEGRLMIERVEPGELYFEGGIGPLLVSDEAPALAKVGREVYVTLVRIAGRW